MAKQDLNLGAAPNDGTGDSLREAGQKIEDNFTELYAAKVPAGGTTGQALVKATDDDFDFDWAEVASGGGGGNGQVLAFASKHDSVLGANSAAAEDIPDMSVTFNLATAGTIELDFDVVLGRASGAIRLLLLIDGVDAPRGVPGETVYNSIPMAEHNNQVLKGKQIYTLAAGNHTIQMRASAVNSVTPARYKDRSMIVRRLA